MYHNFLIHSSADGHLCFQVLAIVNSATVNIGVHMSLSVLVSSMCMPSSGIAGSYGSSISSFLRNLHTVLHSSISSVQFSRSVVSDTLRPHELQHARPSCSSPIPGVHQTHVHRVSDAIQPYHALSSPSPPALNLAQHQGLFK